MRLLECAKIVSTHGIKGEVKIAIITDDISRFTKDNILYLGEEHKEITVSSFRPYKNMGLLTYDGKTNINEVLVDIGKSIYVDVENEEDCIYYDDLIGCLVYEENELIGKVIDVMEVPQGEILRVEKANGSSVLIPYVDEFIIDVDIKEKRIDIHTIEGLI